MPLPALRRQKFFTPSASDAVSPGSMPSRYSSIRHTLLPAAEHGAAAVRRLAERFDPHAVGADQADEAERRGELLGVVQLRRRRRNPSTGWRRSA